MEALTSPTTQCPSEQWCCRNGPPRNVHGNRVVEAASRGTSRADFGQRARARARTCCAHANRECDGTSLGVDASKIGGEHRVSEIEPLGMTHVRCRESRETHHRSMLGPTILPSHTHMCRYCFLHGQCFRLETPWTFD